MRTVEQVLTDVERARWVVRRSGVGPVLDANSRRTNRGRRREGLTGELFMTLLVAGAMQGRCTIQRMHDIATGQLPVQMQWQLGILRRDRAGATRKLSCKQLYDMSEHLGRYLSSNPRANRELTQDELERRAAVLDEIVDALVLATHAAPRVSSALAIDESGVWAWPIGNSNDAARDLPANPGGDEDSETADHDLSADAGSAEHDAAATALAQHGDLSSDRRRDGCPDARWGMKTAKTGTQKKYFGYALHALVRVPDVVGGVADASLEPIYIERFRLTPASTDIVDVTLAMLDRIIEAGGTVREILGDRHYSFKKTARWAEQLWRRGISQVLDLRSDEHGAVDYDGAKIIDGTPHCPGTPQHMEVIERPGLNATDEEKRTFEQRIEQRRPYAMARHASPLGDGKSRWNCPALAGLVGCPFRDGTVQIAQRHGLPVVNPPEAPTRFCTQKTVQIPPGKHMKHAQEAYWGSREWLRSWARRTYVEGLFGNLKNTNTENIHRGFFQFSGLPMVTLAMAAAAASYNIREYENWHDRTGRGDCCRSRRQTMTASGSLITC